MRRERTWAMLAASVRGLYLIEVGDLDYLATGEEFKAVVAEVEYRVAIFLGGVDFEIDYFNVDHFGEAGSLLGGYSPRTSVQN